PFQAYLNNNVAWAILEQVKELPVRPPGDSGSVLALFSPRKVKDTDRSLEEERLDEAKKFAQRAIEIDAQRATAYGCLGIIAYKQGEMLEAESRFQASIRANPRSGGYLRLGSLYTKMGRFEEAKKALDEALKFAPLDAGPRIEMGALLLEIGKTKDAIAILRE